jgi:anti-sigma factor ChrR (cupin superfamily)
MSSGSDGHERDHLASVCLYALQALPSAEVPVVESQLSACAECRRELEALRPLVGAFVSWPTDVLRPPTSLWERLARRVATASGQEPLLAPPRRPVSEWDDVAPGIACKLLATDTENGRVSMLVRLAPGAEYPPHTHAGVEEVHMLEGVLLVDEKKLYPGDYLRSEPGTSDHRVWSETGCTCVLLTSTRDRLR